MSSLPPLPDVPMSKPGIASNTVQASVVAAIPAVILLLNDGVQLIHGVVLNLADQALAAGAAVTVVGAAFAIWGRFKATVPLAGFLKTPKKS